MGWRKEWRQKKKESAKREWFYSLSQAPLGSRHKIGRSGLSLSSDVSERGQEGRMDEGSERGEKKEEKRRQGIFNSD